MQVGLRRDLDNLCAVPGNHDHWGPGKWHPYNGSIFTGHFEDTPWCKTVDITPEIKLELFGVCTNSGYANSRKFPKFTHLGKQILALGSISNQEFENLETQLNNNLFAPGGQKSIRALVLHHSLSNPDSTTRLDKKSKNRLLSIAAEYNVTLLLTGHAHSHGVTDFNENGSTITEIRCPSTLQVASGKSHFPGFLVHDLTYSNGKVNWLVWDYKLDKSTYRFTQNKSKFRSISV